MLLNKNANSNQNETESKMENSTHSFRGMKPVLQLVDELRIKSKSDELSSRKKTAFFCNVYFVRRKFFSHFCFISKYSVLYKLSKYIFFSISKDITSKTFLACLLNRRKPSVYLFLNLSELINFYSPLKVLENFRFQMISEETHVN